MRCAFAPAQFTIQGPESLLRALEYVETGLISIEDAAGPVEAMVEPLLPDPLLRAIGIGPYPGAVVDIAPRERLRTRMNRAAISEQCR